MTGSQNGQPARLRTVAIGRLDPEFRPASIVRVDLSAEAVADYIEDFDRLPAIRLMFDPTADVFWVSDGHHRLIAAVARKATEVMAVVEEGDYVRAFEAACKSNKEVGVRLGRDNRKERVRQACLHPEIGRKTVAEIARICDEPESTARAWVDQFRQTAENGPSNQPDGVDLTATQRQVYDVILAHPDWSDREIERHAGVDRKTVARVRALVKPEPEAVAAPEPDPEADGQATAPALPVVPPAPEETEEEREQREGRERRAAAVAQWLKVEGNLQAIIHEFESKGGVKVLTKGWRRIELEGTARFIGQVIEFMNKYLREFKARRPSDEE